MCASVPSGEVGKAGTRARVGLCPKQPVKPAGMRIEPPPSVPSCSAPMPSTEAATAPAEEPPVVMRVSQGLRVRPVSGLSLVAFQPYSGRQVLPRMTAPCSRILATAGASKACGSLPVSREPTRDGMPTTGTLSLTPSGTPSTAPVGSPWLQRASVGARSGDRAVRVEVAVGVDRRVVALDAGERGLRGLHRRQRLPAIERDKLRGRQQCGVASSRGAHGSALQSEVVAVAHARVLIAKFVAMCGELGTNFAI